MRLDKYLKVTRLIKRRTIANEACDAEKVLVNGKAARASYDKGGRHNRNQYRNTSSQGQSAQCYRARNQRDCR